MLCKEMRSSRSSSRLSEEGHVDLDCVILSPFFILFIFLPLFEDGIGASFS